MNIALSNSGGTVATMSSRDIADLTGSTHDSVLKTIRRLVADGVVSGNETPYKHPQNGQFYPEFLLGFRDTMVVVSGYSAELRARIIDRWQELESKHAETAKPLSQSEIILMMAQRNVEIEQAVAKQQQQLSSLETRIEQVADSRVMMSCPQNAEPITVIRRRIGLKHGLSDAVIDQVMRQHPAAPKPAGLVLNGNDRAQGSKYAVYWTQDVNRLFKLFMSESGQVTGTMFQHPLIENRFKARTER